MFKHIIDEDLELRLISMQDAEDIYTLVDKNRNHLKQWFVWVEKTKSVEDTKLFLSDCIDRYKDKQEIEAGIWYKNRLAGLICNQETNWDNYHTSIGYWLAEDFQGKGCVTRSCQAILDHVFKQLKLHRVEIRCAKENLKSRAIPKRLGFTEEGLIRHAEKLNGHYVDHVVYGLLAEEWLN